MGDVRLFRFNGRTMLELLCDRDLLCDRSGILPSKSDVALP